MMTRKHQLVAALLFALPIGGVASAQPAPTPDPDQPAPTPTQAPAQAPDQESGPVQCPPPPGESNEACPTPGQSAQPQPQAQPEGMQPSTPPTTGYAQPAAGPETAYYHIPWLALSVGGGVEDFAGSALRSSAEVGGSWNVRMTFGQHYWISGEASYIGSAQQMEETLGARRGNIVGNGAQAALRLNGTINYPVQPFIYGGVAWRHYSETNSGAITFADVANTNDAFEVPLGAGLAAYFGSFMVDVRGEYRFGFGGNSNDNLINSVNLDRWGTTGNFGFEF
jgi:hypothetical protein